MQPTQPDSGERRTVDADGVVRTERPRSATAYLAWGGLVVLVLVLGLGWLFVDVKRGDQEEPARSTAGRSGSSSSFAVTERPELASALPPEAAEMDLPDEVYLDQIDPGPGERTGIHLFPRPGTKPIKGGILVPDGFELPPGYMRHYQATDDGEPVPPILVFHPDYHLVDPSGKPIPLPPGRVVPPELAPPGMPIQSIEAPPVRRDFDETSAPPP
jgi:hypothetical protein